VTCVCVFIATRKAVQRDSCDSAIIINIKQFNSDMTCMVGNRRMHNKIYSITFENIKISLLTLRVSFRIEKKVYYAEKKKQFIMLKILEI